MRPAISFITASVLCTTASTASAQLYKWVDDGGVVNYGDWPPAGVKLQPLNRGTLSSVADSALVAPPAPAPGASRKAPRTAGPGVNVRKDASPSNAPSGPDDANAVGTYAQYNGYPWRPLAAEAATERRPANATVAKPLLPIDPAIPDMPLRPRR